MNIGTIIQWASNTIPNGWLLCDGSAVSRTTYSQLFSVIGTNFGVGDGSTTFNLPDLRGRIGVGKDSNDTDFDTLGETGGSKELQKHSHLLKMNGDSNSGWNAPFADNNYIIQAPDMNIYTNGWVSETGTGESGNVQPYVVVNYIIKATTPDTIKISELNELTTLDSDDLIPVVDTSADETKKITASNLLNSNEYILYENSSGTTENIVIENEQFSNYKYLEIYTELGVFKAFKTGYNAISGVVYSDTLYMSYLEFNIINASNSINITVSHSGTYYMNENHPESYKTYKVIGYK